MNTDAIMDILKKLLSRPEIIITAVVCAILLMFVNYIYKYQKKPPKQNIKKSIAAAPAPAEETSAESGTDDDGDLEE